MKRMRIHGSNPSSKGKRHQSGIVLPVVLIFLVVMTLIGVVVIRNVTLEENMAGNLRSSQVALMAADEVMHACENYIKSDATPKLYKNQVKPYIGPGDTLPPLDETKWTDDKYVKKVDFPSGSASPGGLCMIEAFAVPCNTLNVEGGIKDWCNAFRVTARGYGTSKNSVVRTQSHMTFPPFKG